MADEVPESPADTFTLTIAYSQSLAEMIAAGNYDRADGSIIDANFPLGGGASKVKAVLVHLDRPRITSNEVIAEIYRQGLRPANMAELLAFGAQHPEMQRQFPIVALGSVWEYSSLVHYSAVLCGLPNRRELGILNREEGWDELYRFLAIRK